SFSCRAASAGISLRHGTHQVAHRLRRTTRPRQSASVLSAPAPSLKLSTGTRRAASATLIAATSPRASGAMRRAVSSAGRQAASPPLRSKPAIPYTARPLPAIQAATNPAYLVYRRRLGAAGDFSVLTVMIEQTVDVRTVDAA